MSTLKTNQHHVWQYHLKAWADNKDQVWCLQIGKTEPYPSNPRNLASERFFYEFKELTEADERAIQWVIDQSKDERLREVNRGWVDTLQMSFKLRKTIANLPITQQGRLEVERQLQLMDKTVGEDFHTGMEDRGKPSIDALRQGDTSFYLANDEQTIHFIQFICLQYFRTARLRNAVLAIPLDLPHSLEHTWPIETFIYATNLGSSPYAERKRYSIVVLNNHTETPFISGDQPVINMLGVKDSEVRLYYPLTPKIAILFLANEDGSLHLQRNVGPLEVEAYNFSIYQRSGKQIFGNDKGYLASFLDLPKGDLSVDA